jgi:hypothetical protein
MDQKRAAAKRDNEVIDLVSSTDSDSEMPVAKVAKVARGMTSDPANAAAMATAAGEAAKSALHEQDWEERYHDDEDDEYEYEEGDDDDDEYEYEEEDDDDDDIIMVWTTNKTTNVGKADEAKSDKDKAKEAHLSSLWKSIPKNMRHLVLPNFEKTKDLPEDAITLPEMFNKAGQPLPQYGYQFEVSPSKFYMEAFIDDCKVLVDTARPKSVLRTKNGKTSLPSNADFFQSVRALILCRPF